MKSIIKKINVLGLVALFVAGGSALAMNNLEVNLADHYYNAGTQATPNWKPLTRIMGNSSQPGTYSCNLLVENICTAQFSTEPAQNEPAPLDAIEGSYVENN